MWKQLKQWYMDTLLPYENPTHPLYAGSYIPDQKTSYDNEMLQEIADYIDDELAYQDARREMIGPNYARQMGAKPTEYEKWGDKWYRKG